MIGRAGAAWGRWRRTRPFWGGLLIILAGAEILATERIPLRVVLHLGVEGVAGFLLPVVMILCGLLLWFNPQQRLFYSLLAFVLSLGTWITSNLGGFILGLVLGLVGAALAFAWTPGGRVAGEPTTRGGVAGWLSRLRTRTH